ncbi:MAG: hypothetical protein ABI878_06810 [Acidobacteriota bacterium]
MKISLLITLFLAICVLSIAAADAKAQSIAYGISIVCADDVQCGDVGTHTVDGYSGTWLNYNAGLYYDPDVIGDIYRTDNPETSLSNGRSIGYSDIIPAEVYLGTSNYVEGKTYCTFSQHAVWSYFYYASSGLWFDPGRYDLIGNGNPPWPGLPFIYYYVIPRRHFLGTTQACITIPLSPTPTPTPTPTPSPTPCDPALLASCTDSTVSIYLSPTALKPSGTAGGTNTARVSVCITPAAANQDASFQLVRRPTSLNSGGHIEVKHTGQRPLGKLAKASGKTGSDGCFTTTYSPSHISGIAGVNGTITGTAVGADVGIAVPGFFTLLPGQNYNLVGTTLSHPSNHWGTPGTVDSLPLIADDYKALFYGSNPIPTQDKISFNDMALEWGGKFDLGEKWSNAGHHDEHDEGINCDVRSANVPNTRWNDLRNIFNARGFGIHDETQTNAPHWHLRFGVPTNDFASVIVNGIEQNANSFVEVNTGPVTPGYLLEQAWSATFDRETTQDEWENWHSQLVDAKTQGQSPFLNKVNALEHILFSESEYLARHRTDEEFVGDVFASHLLREITQQEQTYWVNYLHSLPIGLPKQRKRITLIEQFESRQAFQDAIFAVIAEDAPPTPTPTP